MGFLSFLGVGAEAGKAIATPVKAIGEVFDELFTSDEERAAADTVMTKLQQEPAALQVKLNMVEAQHRSLFVAGWRPFIGWVCGASLGLYYIPQFAMASILWIRLCWSTSKLLPYPVTGIDGLLELMGGMLGLALLRTVEKNKHLTK